MAIISVNPNKLHGYRSSQFLYAMTYVIITVLALTAMNYYCAVTSERLIYQSKEVSLVEKCQLASDDFSSLSHLDIDTVAEKVNQMESLRASRLIVTDAAGTALYDSGGSLPGTLVLLPEVLQALNGQENFNGQYKRGNVICRAASPIRSHGRITGCLYIAEHDPDQGLLIRRLQINIFQITVLLEVIVVLFSLFYSSRFSLRVRKIMNSMRIIQDGNYSHKAEISGKDELAFLGKEVNELTDRLQLSEQKRRQFVSDASHEIKTPLASIKLLSDSILQNEMDADTMREFVGDIGSEAERLNRMTEKLLSLTRIDSEPEQDIEIINMIPTLQRVYRMLQPSAEQNGITLKLDAPRDCPVLITEDDLYQIVFNLMENGIKYNLPGGSLTATLERTEESAVLTVADTGMGFPEEDREIIFERFYRVDKARSRATGGSGLGLSIVKAIVQNNNGTIRASANPGGGSRFTVTFPLFDMEVEE